MQTEFGGYLPLELPTGSEWFDRYGADVLRLDSGRNAIHIALKEAGAAKVYLPRYTCDTVYAAAQAAGVAAVPYLMDENLFPQAPPLRPGEWLLYTDYYGTVPPETLERVQKTYHNVIFDNTQALFRPPVLDGVCYNVYSCRKFVGVCDGAYLIKKGLAARELPRDSSWQRAAYLLKSIECGTNGAYPQNKASEEQLTCTPKAMSALTQRILQSVDYNDLARRRQQNFAALHRLLGPYNQFDFWQNSNTPMAYPFCAVCPGLRQKLVANKVYVPQWWKWVLEFVPETSIEAKLSQWLLPLPVDQRYTTADMEQLAALVLALLRECEAEHQQ